MKMQRFKRPALMLDFYTSLVAARRAYLVIVLVRLLITAKCQHYDEEYRRTTDDVEDDNPETYQGNETKQKDYTKYYTHQSSTPVASSSSYSVKQEDSTGFVTPLDFTGLFTDTRFGLSLGANTIHNVRKPANTHTAFGLLPETSVSTNNHARFVLPSEFKSVFDIASLTSNSGLKPKDFPASESNNENIKFPNFFLPPVEVGQNNAPIKVNPIKTDVETKNTFPSLKIKPPIEKYKKLSNQKVKLQNKKFDVPEKHNTSEEYTTSYSSPTTETELNTQHYDYDTPKFNEAYSTTSFSAGHVEGASIPDTEEPHSGKLAYPISATYKVLNSKTQYYPLPSIKNKIRYLPNTITPYEKHNFKPSNYYQIIQKEQLPTGTSSTNFDASSPSEIHLVTSSKKNNEDLSNNKCRRIEKQYPQEISTQDRFQQEKLVCFLCKDAKSDQTYEQCVYVSKPKEIEHYSGQKYHIKSESNPVSSFRQKRETRKTKNKNYESEDDPYDYSAKSYKYKSQPSEFLASPSYKAPDFKEFDYDPKEDETYDDPNYYSFDPIIESHSNQQFEQLQKEGANCKKVDKKTMTCMVCENPKTGGNFEQCSYTSKPNEKKYAFTKERKYDSNDDESDDDGEDESDEQEGTELKPTTVDEKSSSKQHSKKSDSDKEVCEDVKRDNLLCKICKNSKTGGKTEKCSYRSEPPPKQYSYRKERKYLAKPKVTEDEDTEQSQHKPRITKSAKESYHNDDFKIPKHFEEDINDREKKIKSGGIGLDPDLYGTPLELKSKEIVEDDKEEENEDDKRQDSKNDKKEESSENSETHEEPSSLNYEEYFAKIFPEYATKKSEVGDEESASHQSKEYFDFKDPDKFFAESSQKDVEKVLAEFTKKDRSNCKKVIRNKLTCYLCIDKKGMKHEECMYVAESQPKSSHMAYHQVQKYKSPKKTLKKLDTSASKSILSNITNTNGDKVNDTGEKQKRKYKKAASIENTAPVTFAPLSHSSSKSNSTKVLKRSTENLQKNPLPLASNIHYITRKPLKKDLKRSESRNKQKKLSKKKTQIDEKEPDIPKPIEFQVEGSDGAFASELRPVYSKKLGVTLPAFMLTKSEHEASFDEAVTSG